MTCMASRSTRPLRKRRKSWSQKGSSGPRPIPTPTIRSCLRNTISASFSGSRQVPLCMSTSLWLQTIRACDRMSAF